MKVISGGQYGVDRIGLEVARSLGITTGGTAPKGFRTENGPDLSLKEFGLVEHSDYNYSARTRQNVLDADGTVLFGDYTSHGSAETIKYCKELKKPFLKNPTADELVAWLYANKIQVLNVAGNRGSKMLTIQFQVYTQVLRTALQQYINLE